MEEWNSPWPHWQCCLVPWDGSLPGGENHVLFYSHVLARYCNPGCEEKPENQSGSSADAEGLLSDVCCGGGSLLTPPLQSILPMFCPGTQHCAGPMCHAVTVGWMVQRSSNLHPSPRSSQNLLFWKHLRGEMSILEVTVAQDTPFLFHSLGKACSPLISILWGAFSPHLNSFYSLSLPLPPLI